MKLTDKGGVRAWVLWTVSLVLSIGVLLGVAAYAYISDLPAAR